MSRHLMLGIVLIVTLVGLIGADVQTQQQTLQYHQWSAQGGSAQISGPGEYNVTGGPTDAEINELIETILSQGRQGRNVDGYDDVYSDPTIQNALNSGDDVQARNLIKDKLCNLGLMQCDDYSIEGKRPNYYVTRPFPPNGPPPPRPPSSSFHGPYGPPKPMPLPGPTNFNGPPRKVGYGGPPIKSGSYFSGPPSFSSGSSFSSSGPGPVYLSKPPGPVYDGPYEFENPGKLSLEHSSLSSHSSHIKQHDLKPSPTIVVNAHGGAATNDAAHGAGLSGGAIQQHVHHHYHHGEGDAKIPTVVVNNPSPVNVPVPIAHGNSINEFSSSGFQGSLSSISSSNGGGFSPVTSGFGFNGKQQTSEYGSLNGGIITGGVNSGLGGGVNSIGGNGGYGSGGYASGSKPVFEGSQNSGLYNQGPATFGSQTSFGQSVSGVYNDQSFHSNNPDFYKKELNVNGYKGNGLSQYSQANYQQGGQFNQFNSGEKYQGQFDRQETLDCVCVPYEQCPARDVLGRKDDLILPLDPRNLDKNIDAISEDAVDGANATISTTTVASNTTKKITKRDVSELDELPEKKSDDNLEQADGEARLLKFGAYGGGVPDVLGGKKHVVPTFGVSFGLPYPSGGYPTNPYGPYPGPNPYGGALNANGLNLGLVNVNPLVSFQVSKNEYGEKLVKPLVNLHVTPNEHLITKVGSLLHAKKQALFGGGGGGGYGGYGGSINQHYHTHTHLSEPPALYHPHHHPHPHPHEHYPQSHYPTTGHSGPDFYPSQNYGGAYGYPTGPQGYYRENTDSTGPGGYYQDNTGPGSEFDPSFFYSRSANATQYDIPNNNQQQQNKFFSQNSIDNNNFPNNYANNYQQYSQIQNSQNNYNQQNTPNEGAGRNVAFPTSRRRRRDTNQKENKSSIENKDSIQERSLNAEKRQYFGPNGRPPFNNQIQQCGPRQVCCRRSHVIQPQRAQCGTRNSQGINGRIKNPVYVDGDSEFGEYPWQVAILKKDPKESVYVCGGTLIDHLHIITAAHCIKSYHGQELRVRLGEWDVNHDVEFYPYIERDITVVQVHPEYYAGTLDNDIAILRMDRPVDFAQYPHISPACLPDKFTDFTGSRCWTTGWGKDAFGDYGKYQNILKEVDVPIIADLQCQQQLRQTRLGYNYKLNPGFICAGGEEGKDACKGDGGGPLVCERNGSWKLVGVVSWGIGCGQVNVPGVYARVAYYLDWIAQVTHQF